MQGQSRWISYEQSGSEQSGSETYLLKHQPSFCFLSCFRKINGKIKILVGTLTFCFGPGIYQMFYPYRLSSRTFGICLIILCLYYVMNILCCFYILIFNKLSFNYQIFVIIMLLSLPSILKLLQIIFFLYLKKKNCQLTLY